MHVYYVRSARLHIGTLPLHPHRQDAINKDRRGRGRSDGESSYNLGIYSLRYALD